jgi:prepilin-type N-terminal cleavage/methylation domain-containing protein
MKKRKGFTLVELLVVIAIIALLMSILMPALAMVRKLAMRAVCGSNLAGLHKAMITYSADNKDNYPRAGGPDSIWGSFAVQTGNLNPNGWDARNEGRAFNRTANSNGIGNLSNGYATISASLYLLIREADVGPKSFICKAEKQTKIFNLDEYPRPQWIKELRNGWDFGKNQSGNNTAPRTSISPNPPPGYPVVQYYSYAYQIPYGGISNTSTWLSTASPPEVAALADKSPYLVISPSSSWRAFVKTSTGNERFATNTYGNSANHERDGQNVLFCNGSVSFKQVPYCGMNDDNIYTMALDPTRSSVRLDNRIGFLPFMTEATMTSPTASPLFWGTVASQDTGDSVLINEGGRQGAIREVVLP